MSEVQAGRAMPPEEIERERQWAWPVASAAIGVAVLFVISLIFDQGGRLAEGDNRAEQLIGVDRHATRLLLGTIAGAASFALMAPPLLYLFRAARARSERVVPALIGLALVGPFFIAVGLVVREVALAAVAADFVTGGAGQAKADIARAKQLYEDSVWRDVGASFILGGFLALAIALVYIPLQAVRTGLLTRFIGTLGMALGATLVLLGPFTLMVWFALLGLILAGLWPGGRPPAWEAGQAIPWPKPGETPTPPSASD